MRSSSQLRTELLEIQLLENIYPSKKKRKLIVVEEINQILCALNRDELIKLIQTDLDILKYVENQKERVI